MCSVIFFIFREKKKIPHCSSVMNACCRAENDLERCKWNEQEFCELLFVAF